MVDLDELREAQLRRHRLAGTERVYTFYHDETNNIQKLRVGEKGLNVARLTVFVVGGLAHEGPPRPLDIQNLRNALRIQKSADEIKLRHVAKGDFLELMESPRLAEFLRWVSANGLMVHYHDLDPLYWSIVDIIDSILPGLGDQPLFEYHALLKSDLAAILRAALPDTIALFHRRGYPGLAPDQRRPFLDDVVALLDQHRELLPAQNAHILRSVLRAGRRLDRLEFIEGYPPNLLIEDFTAFYVNRIALFKNSHHILDMEDSIRDRVISLAPVSVGKPATHFRFADSKAEPGIQLADVMVGLIGKMLTYFTHTSEEEVGEARDALADTGRQNANLLRDLIAGAHEANTAFLHHVGSLHDLDKLDRFLMFTDGRYAISSV